jgi:hypothetical protein
LLKRSGTEKRGKNYLWVNMGYIPDSLLSDRYNINLLLLRKKKLCRIINLSGVCGSLFNYDPGKLPYYIELSSPKIVPAVKTDTITLSVFFEKNQWDYDISQLAPALKMVSDNHYEVIRALVSAFASVEGTEEINENLYNKRAKAILSQFEAKQDSAIPMTITMQENWPLFFKQLKGTKWENLLSKDTVEIRKFINDKEVAADMEYLLKKQRYTYVRMVARKKITEENIDSLAYDELINLQEKLMKTLLKNGYSGNLTGSAKKMQQRMEELQCFLYGRFRSGKLRDTSVFSFSPEKHPALAGCLYNKALFNFRWLQGTEYSFYKELEAIMDLKADHGPTTYHYLAFLINHQDDDLFGSLLTSGMVKKCLDILTAGNMDKEKIKRIELFYHFKYTGECMQAGNLKKAGPSLSFIYNHYRSQTLSDSLKYALANHFICFRKYDYARYFLEPLVFRDNPDPDAYALFLHLQYSGLTEARPGDYYDEIMKAGEILSKETWCGLFSGPCAITFQLLDYEPLHNLYCIKCKEGNNP